MPWSLRHHQCECAMCHSRWFVKPDDFLSISEDSREIEDLITTTNPGLRSVQSRLDALTAANNPRRPTHSERQEWLVDCLRNAGRLIEPRRGPDYIAYGMLVILLFIIGRVLFILLVTLILRAISPSLEIRWAHLGGTSTLIEWIVWAMLFGWALRFVFQHRRRKLYAAARSAMSRVSPTPEEVYSAVAEAKQKKLSICRFISTSKLARRLTPF